MQLFLSYCFICLIFRAQLAHFPKKCHQNESELIIELISVTTSTSEKKPQDKTKEHSL